VLPTTSPAPAAAPAPSGQITVRSTPVGARVFLDGRDVGRTPVAVPGLSRGTHTVRVARDGYVTAQQRVTISASQPSRSVSVRLSPARP
jgi:hypothetical protein